MSAIEWLCNHLGFKKKVVFSQDDIVHHAQLTHGQGMIMVGSKRDGDYDKHISSPSDLGGANTQSAYIYVADIKQHYEDVVSKNIEIAIPYQVEPHGAGFTCRDLEGHLWSFGDFNPWQEEDS